MKADFRYRLIICYLFFLAGFVPFSVCLGDYFDIQNLPKAKGIKTIIIFQDSIAYFKNVNSNYFHTVRYRPFLNTRPPYLPKVHHWIKGLDGDFLIEVKKVNGQDNLLIYNNIISVEKEPFYFQTKYSDGEDGEIVIEEIPLPEMGVLLFRAKNNLNIYYNLP
jgi:hypothetical protein